MAKQKSKKEEFQFQAEMDQLLHLITHSLYSHREIFLRELISNSSDALQKLHFASLTDNSVFGDDGELRISIQLDEEKKTLSIIDNGVGMNHDELINNIGTIARSGTSNFVSKLTGDQKKDSELIGRFGVGFYSVFMVTKEVTVETRSYQSEQGYRWVSKGTGSYSIEEIEKKDRGTQISFKLKKDCEEFAAKWKMENVIRKYSDFVSFPIFVNDEQVNKATAIWRRQKNEVKKEEYDEFFKYISHKNTEPMDYLHLSVEAPAQFNSILYIPNEPEETLWTTQRETALHLYVKRVFIQDDCKDLLPSWLRFVYGVVDSEDLPLNVSREVTQNSPLMEKINKYLVRKLLGEFKSWAEKAPEKYANFWKNFGNILKEGLHTDFANREKLLELYRCSSSKEPDQLVSLKDYVDRMKKDQEEIYYVYGKTKEIIENSPNLEYFKKHEIEVLYLYEEIDDFLMPSIGPYKEKNLVGIDKADIKLDGSKDENAQDELAKSVKGKLLGYFKDILGDRVEDVIESKRLVDSPCTLVSSKEAMNAHMERMMKMMNKDFQGKKRILELNLGNPLVRNLSEIQQKFPQDKLLKDCILQLYENAILLEGSLEDPSEMVPRTNNLMEKATDLYLNTLTS